MTNSYWLIGTRLSILAGHADIEGRLRPRPELVPRAKSPPHRHGAYSE